MASIRASSDLVPACAIGLRVILSVLVLTVLALLAWWRPAPYDRADRCAPCYLAPGQSRQTGGQR